MNVVAHEAGRKLDKLIALKLMGWLERPDGSLWEPGRRQNAPVHNIPHYSTEIADAWKVAEKINLFKNCRHLYQDGVGIQNGSTWTRAGWEWVIEQVFEPIGHNVVITRGETAPLAICRAALLVAENEK
jgi:hypothetical protein